MIESPYLVVPGKKLSLADRKTRSRGEFKDRSEAMRAVETNRATLHRLQEVLYAQGRYAVLIVFQAMDGGGKDGAIEHVFHGVNPQGCRVASFKVPTPAERAHDYMWRYHLETPNRGMIGIFNRSHYESVLVERVKGIVEEDVWAQRYEQINQFEAMLASEGTIILKFFLHISRDEQRRRLQARLDDPEKRWKFNPGDLQERARWDKYMEAYEDALQRCSKRHAPWYVIPSDRKWFRNWAVSDLLVRTLDRLDLRYPPAAAGLDKVRID
jgi:PPK2 family polyphosphate:nucleotide phosphotransferase